MDYFCDSSEDEISTDTETSNYSEVYDQDCKQNSTWQLNVSNSDLNRLYHDPFFNILSGVFQNLDAQDLLNASLVSKTWDSIIGKLNTFSRIKLNYIASKNQKVASSDTDVLKYSERFYESISMQVNNTIEDNLIADQTVRKYSRFLKSLRLIKYGGQNSILNDMPLEFSKLVELELQAIGGRLSGRFIEDVTTLEKLTINGLEPRMLPKILCNNNDLQELTIYENAFIGYFEEDMSGQVDFQLKRLKVLDHNNQKELRLNGEFPARNWSGPQRLNFFKFVSIQSNLHSLHLDAIYWYDINFILKKSSINLLEINRIIGNCEQLHETIYNNAIETFITSMDIADINKLQALLSLIPNVQSLYIFKLYLKDFIQLIENENFCMNLQNFYYFWAAEKKQDAFVNLKDSFDTKFNIGRSTIEEFINLFSP